MQLAQDFKEFIESLNDAGVRYLVVGGYAVAFHGHPRATDDIDFFVEASSHNAQRLEAALKSFGFGALGLTAADFLKPGAVIQLGREPLRIDILTALDGVRFEHAWRKRIMTTLDGLRVPFLSRSHLLRNKRAAGRPADLADLRSLKRRARRKGR